MPRIEAYTVNACHPGTPLHGMAPSPSPSLIPPTITHHTASQPTFAPCLNRRHHAVPLLSPFALLSQLGPEPVNHRLIPTNYCNSQTIVLLVQQGMKLSLLMPSEYRTA